MSYGTLSVVATATGPTTASFNWSVAAASANWTASFSGSPAGGTLSSTSSSGTSTGSSGTITVTGLAPSTSYTFTMSLSGAAGVNSFTSNSITTSALPTYTITYNGNASTGGTTTTTTGTLPLTVAANGFTRTGYSFTGWNTLATGLGTSYAAGSTYNSAASITLYAQWQQLVWNITWDLQSGTYGGSLPSTVAQGSSVTLPAFGAVTRSGYYQNGWYSTQLGMDLTSTAHNVTPTANITFVVSWVANTPAPSFTDSTLAAFTCGVSYSDGVSASDTSSYSTTGTLPSGISLNTSTGVVTGTPDGSNTSYSFYITASGAGGSTNTGTFSGNVLGLLSVYNGTAWVKKPAQIYSGTTWSPKPVYVYNGTTWVATP